MSLINQALRKAQRDRTPNRMNTPEQVSSAASNAPSGGMKPSLAIGMIACIALLIGLIVGLSVVLIKDKSSTGVETTQAPPAPIAATTAPPAELAPASTPASVPATDTPLATDKLENEPDVIAALEAAREAAVAKAAAEAEAAAMKAEAEAEAARVAAMPPNQMTLNWLEEAQVSGVRISSTESKVILNGKAYSVGDFAHYGLGLKVLSIEQDRIFFIAANGKKYMKQL